MAAPLSFQKIFFQLCTNVGDNFSAGKHRLQKMVKGKAGKVSQVERGKGPKVPDRVSHHIVLQGESCKPLLEYVKKNSAHFISHEPPGQLPTQSSPEPSILDGSTKLLLFMLIDMLDDLVNAGVCLEKLKVEMLVLLSNGCPKLIGATFQERKGMRDLKQFKEKVSEIFYDLSIIISRDVLAPVSYSLPADVTHLLFLMKSNPWGMRLLINYHQATVPLENYTSLFLRLYNYSWDILRWKDPSGFEYVLSGLEFDPLWRSLIQHNIHLLNYYQNSPYQNNFSPGSAAYLYTERRQVLRFNRNGPSHPLECAYNAAAVDGMLYSQCAGLGHMYLTHFGRLTFSIQVALQAIERLKFVELRSLFTNTRKEYVEIR